MLNSMLKQISIRKILLFGLLFLTVQISANNDSISLGDLFMKNKIQSITVLDFSKIQFHLQDTMINRLRFFETQYSDSLIELIRSHQIEVYGSVKIEPYYMSRFDLANILTWAIPIFILLLLWTPGILAIIYFVRSNMKIGIKILIIAILVFLPISGIIIYPLRYKIYHE
jgi:hypothetical protein